MSALPSGMEEAFHFAASELGMCSASWLFVREVHAEHGPPLVNELRDRLGRTFPVLDAVAQAFLEGQQQPVVEADRVVSALSGATRVVVVGVESAFLDQLVPKLTHTRVALLKRSIVDVDWERVYANYQDRVEQVDMDTFQSWAGPKSVLLTYAYGLHGHRTHVRPSWLRATGEDVRTQFRSLVAWNVLQTPMFFYPRWLVETDLSTFTHVV